MRDYAELVKALRTCKMSIPCTECPFYRNGDKPTKECATMNDAAADAIEDLLAESADLVEQVKCSQEEIRKLDKELATIRNQPPKEVE